MELATSSKTLAEVSGRTNPNPNDIILALIEMGANISQLPEYLKHAAAGSIIIPARKLTDERMNRVKLPKTEHLHFYEYDKWSGKGWATKLQSSEWSTSWYKKFSLAIFHVGIH